MPGRPQKRGDGIIELVGDPSAEFAEHGKTRTFDKLCARCTQVFQGSRQFFFLALQVFGQHRIFDVKVLGAHEASRQ